MVNSLDSIDSEIKTAEKPRSSNWLKIAILTAGSALAGGIAAAWWYRKTLEKLRETGETQKNPHFGISGERRSADRDEEI
jgi:hypothetical protein